MNTEKSIFTNHSAAYPSHTDQSFASFPSETLEDQTGPLGLVEDNFTHCELSKPIVETTISLYPPKNTLLAHPPFFKNHSNDIIRTLGNSSSPTDTLEYSPSEEPSEKVTNNPIMNRFPYIPSSSLELVGNEWLEATPETRGLTRKTRRLRHSIQDMQKYLKTPELSIPTPRRKTDKLMVQPERLELSCVCTSCAVF